MHRPPEARYHFTIPSIHDDVPLDCRVYIPAVVAEPPFAAPPWRKQGIVLSHPYTPMGGTYDDRVICVAVDEFLKAGYIVGTFNFRYGPGLRVYDAN